MGKVVKFTKKLTAEEREQMIKFAAEKLSQMPEKQAQKILQESLDGYNPADFAHTKKEKSMFQKFLKFCSIIHEDKLMREKVEGRA